MNYRTRKWLVSTLHAVLLLGFLGTTSAAEPELERLFRQHVAPFLNTYCLQCHGQDKQEGKLDLSRYTSTDAAAKDFRTWETISDRLAAEEMPPEKAKQPAKFAATLYDLPHSHVTCSESAGGS